LSNDVRVYLTALGDLYDGDLKEKKYESSYRESGRQVSDFWRVQ